MTAPVGISQHDGRRRDVACRASRSAARSRKIAAVADKMAFVRSFAHTNSGHGGGTHYVMTGYDNRMVDNGGVPSRPALRLDPGPRPRREPPGDRHADLRADRRHPQAGGPAFLGTAYAPFDQDGQARRSMTLVAARRAVRRPPQPAGVARRHQPPASMPAAQLEGMKKFEQQAFNLVLGTAAEGVRHQEGRRQDAASATARAWANRCSPPAACAKPAAASSRSTTAAGTCTATSPAAWTQRSPQLDQAVVGLRRRRRPARPRRRRILLVITGEFGRTPRVNRNAGRDHWAPLSTLALAGGGLKMGQVVGESASKVDVPGTHADPPAGPDGHDLPRAGHRPASCSS